MRPAFLECTACSKRTEVGLVNTCDCGGPPLAAPTVRTVEEARAYLGLKPRAS